MSVYDLREKIKDTTNFSFDKNFIVFSISLLLPLFALLGILAVKYISFDEISYYELKIGTLTDTNVTELYLEPNPSLSERKTRANTNETYRNLYSTAKVIFRPNKFKENATATLTITGSDVSVILPQIDFDPYFYKWNNVYDFENGYPQKITGSSFSFDGRMFFDGQTGRVEIPTSKDLYDTGPFTVYAKWEPRSNATDYQQIVGRFNWEIFQNKESVIFQVGRVDNNAGRFVILTHPVTEDFFGSPHELIAIYKPKSLENQIGYIEMYIDNKFVGRELLGSQKIWNNYGNHNISFGKSKHGVGTFYNGFIDKVFFATSTPEFTSTTVIQNISTKLNPFTLVGATGSVISNVKINVENR